MSILATIGTILLGAAIIGGNIAAEKGDNITEKTQNLQERLEKTKNNQKKK